MLLSTWPAHCFVMMKYFKRIKKFWICLFYFNNIFYSAPQLPSIPQKLVLKYCRKCLNENPNSIFSSPEQKVLRVSYCDLPLSAVRRPSCVVRKLFSSPEHEVLSELLWSFNVRRPSGRASVRASVNNFFKLHLLWNRLLDFDQTSQKWSLGGPLSKLFKPFQLVA